MQERKIIGRISQDIIDKLSLDIASETPIFISESNIVHIRETHKDAYIKYFGCLTDIIEHPDYIGIAGVYAPSIEYIRKFEIEGELVNVAVRASRNGTFYLRSMFIIEEGRINDYLKKGHLIRT